jgi:Tfp pilus assembly protein PilF
MGLIEKRVVLSLAIGISFFIISLIVRVNSLSADEVSELEYTRGIHELQLGNYDKALEHFKKTIEIDPKNGEAFYYMGVTLNRLAEYEKAIPAFEKALSLKPDLNIIYLDYGISLFELGRYEDAIEKFKVSYIHYPDTAILNHYMGLTLFKLGRYREAISHFQRARELDPKLAPPSYYYTGIMEYRNWNFLLAKEALKKAYELSPDTDLGGSAKELLTEIERKEREKRWSIYARTAIQYDDNVIVQPKEEEGYFSPTQIVDEKDWKWLFYSKANYSIFWNPNWDMGIALTIYNTTHNDLSAYDLLGLTPSLFFNYRMKDLMFKLSMDRDYYQLGHDDYLHSNAFTAEASWIETQKAFISGSLRVSKNNYVDVPGRDSIMREYRLDQYYFFKQDFYLRIGGRLEEENTDSDDYDYTGYGAEGTFSIPIIKILAVNFTGGYLIREYRHRSSTFKDSKGNWIKRHDERATYGVEIVGKINKFLSVSMNWLRVWNQSNITFYEYKRNVYGFNLIFQF